MRNQQRGVGVVPVSKYILPPLFAPFDEPNDLGSAPSTASQGLRPACLGSRRPGARRVGAVGKRLGRTNNVAAAARRYYAAGGGLPNAAACERACAESRVDAQARTSAPSSTTKPCPPPSPPPCRSRARQRVARQGSLLESARRAPQPKRTLRMQRQRS